MLELGFLNTNINDDRDGPPERHHLTGVIDSLVVNADHSANHQHTSLMELVEEHDELDVEEDDDEERNEEDEDEYGKVVAGHAERAIRPVDGARRERVLHRVRGPAGERRRAPEERHARTRGSNLQARGDRHHACRKRVAHNEELVNRDHAHYVHARAADLVHQKRAQRAKYHTQRPSFREHTIHQKKILNFKNSIKKSLTKNET